MTGGDGVWPYIGPMLTGAAGFVTALAGLVTVRPRRISSQLQECAEEREQCEQQSDRYRQQVLIALGHIFRLEKALTMAGKKPPARPRALDL